MVCDSEALPERVKNDKPPVRPRVKSRVTGSRQASKIETQHREQDQSAIQKLRLTPVVVAEAGVLKASQWRTWRSGHQISNP